MIDMTWIFRFSGKMPRGMFVYVCGTCGNEEVVNIPFDVDKVNFECKCGISICIWRQSDHWHMGIYTKEK